MKIVIVALALGLCGLAACETEGGGALPLQTESWVDTECEFQPPCEGAAWVRRPQLLGRADLSDTMTAVCYWSCPLPEGQVGRCPDSCDDPSKSVAYSVRTFDRSTTECEPWIDPSPPGLSSGGSVPQCSEPNPVYVD